MKSTCHPGCTPEFCQCSTEGIAKTIREALCDGHVVDIEGLGVFRPVPASTDFEFVPDVQPRIFLAYVEENYSTVRRLYQDLKCGGYQPWLDKEKLLPGQNWTRSIDRAIEVSDFFVPCFSQRAILKRGAFQAELRFALDCASRMPLDDMFVIPVRLENCVLPDRIKSKIHHVDLFPNWEHGLTEIHRAIDHELTRRRRVDLPLAV
jgi:hypothetical protein